MNFYFTYSSARTFFFNRKKNCYWFATPSQSSFVYDRSVYENNKLIRFHSIKNCVDFHTLINCCGRVYSIFAIKTEDESSNFIIKWIIVKQEEDKRDKPIKSFNSEMEIKNWIDFIYYLECQVCARVQTIRVIILLQLKSAACFSASIIFNRMKWKKFWVFDIIKVLFVQVFDIAYNPLKDKI